MPEARGGRQMAAPSHVRSLPLGSGTYGSTAECQPSENC